MEGYKQATEVQLLLRNDETLQNLTKEQIPHLRMRKNQFMQTFSFWGHPESCEGNNMYEMRSYVLKVLAKKKLWHETTQFFSQVQ